MTLGISSAYSAYTEVDNFYKLEPVSPIKEIQENSAGNELLKPESEDDIKDEAVISDEAKSLFEQDKANEQTKTEKNQNEDAKSSAVVEELTLEEKQQVAELKAADIEVKAHEQAHMAAAAGLNVSGPSYEYQTGPDGKKYAVAGEVSISLKQGSDPETNIQNAEKMKAAALAPANPSGQDRAVARSADGIIASARQELAEQQTKNTEPPTEESQITQGTLTEESEDVQTSIISDGVTSTPEPIQNPNDENSNTITTAENVTTAENISNLRTMLSI